MSKEIIINADKNQTRIALIEDGELAELHIESTDNERTLGDIYMGRVRRTMPSIQAAFIDIGQKQDAFLHYSDLADNLPQWLDYLQNEKPDVSQVALEVDDLPRVARGKSRRSSGNRQTSGNRQSRGRRDRGEKSDKSDVVAAESGDGELNTERNGKSSKSKSGSESRAGAPRVNTKPPEAYLDKGKRILVKIVKEPISAKGSRVSTDISLAGRFLVLVPLANYVAVSKKIFSYKERRRLRALARSLLPAGFGVIVRTVAEGKKAKELDTDLRLLLEKWRKLEKRLEGMPAGPSKVHEDVSMASSVIRDLFSDDYDRILIDEPKLFKNVKNYVQAVAPHMVPAVLFHKGKQHIFKETKIAHDVKQAFDSRVDLPSGGYLFIEQTEAMHVVDVNSGRAGRGLSQENNSLKVDVEAVHAITKQIRLRDLGGIIVIDFIDLREERNRKKVYFELKKAFARDRAVTKILPMSDFGLVEITRQRLRPSITKTFSNTPDGEVKEDVAQRKPQRRERPPARSMTIEGFVEKIERWITSYKTKGQSRVVTLQVHPFAAAFLTQKIPAYTTRWFLKYFIRVKLKIDETLDPLGFRFINPKTGEEFVRRSADRRGRGRNNAGRKGAERSGTERGGSERKGAGRKSGERNSSGRSSAAGSESAKSNQGSDERRKSSSKRSDSRRGSSNRSDSGRSTTNRNSSGKGNTSRRDADKSPPAGNDAESSNSDKDGKDDARRSSSGRSSSGRGGANRSSSGRSSSNSRGSGRSSSGRGNSSRGNSSRSNSSRNTPENDNPKSDGPGKGESVKGEEKPANRDQRSNTDREKPDDK